MKKLIIIAVLTLLALVMFTYIIPLILFTIKQIVELIIVTFAVIGAIALFKKDKSDVQE
jgi:hypothetical protein